MTQFNTVLVLLASSAAVISTEYGLLAEAPTPPPKLDSGLLVLVAAALLTGGWNITMRSIT